MSSILMHGPEIDGKGKIVEVDVPESDIHAYKIAGYTEGPAPTIKKGESEIHVGVSLPNVVDKEHPSDAETLKKLKKGE